MRVGLLQLTSTADRGASTEAALVLIKEAAAAGAQFVLTPEGTPFLAARREETLALACAEADDPSLPRFQAAAKNAGVWLLIGSIPLRDGAGDKLVNRSFLIAPDGAIIARYDKIHLFDVDLGAGRTYRESDTYRAGDKAVLADGPWGRLGMTICYDVRFPHLYRDLGRAGATLIAVPSAFTKWTGEAHWHVLLRARAIETGAFILAPAQVGDHGGGRLTYGHSLIVGPWGEVLADAGETPGLVIADLDLHLVEEARRKVPAWSWDQPYDNDRF